MPSLIAKWRKQVTESEERRLMEIVALFGIGAYRAGSLLPSQEYWISDQAMNPAGPGILQQA